MPFGEDPIGRLGDYVGAVRAAFASFASGEAPSYESPHYRLTRLQPYFNPGPDADGGRCRPSTSAACSGGPASWPGPWRTASSATRPTPTRATCARPACPPWRRAHGRRGGTWPSAGFETVIGTSVITGASPDAVAAERERQRRLLAFLYSTPAYAPDARALRLDGAGAPPARADPPRPLGRPGGRALRRGARHPRALRHVRRAARACCATASPGWARASWCPRRPTSGDDEAFRPVVEALQAA